MEWACWRVLWAWAVFEWMNQAFSISDNSTGRLSSDERIAACTTASTCRPASPVTAGGRASLAGFPLADAEDMPDIAANSLSIAFGDFRRGYLIVDRQGVRVLRDPYSSKPYVLFYTTKRVGGGVQDFDAVKLMKFGTT